MDNGRTFGLCGEQEVKYADVTPGGEGMEILLRSLSVVAERRK